MPNRRNTTASTWSSKDWLRGDTIRAFFVRATPRAAKPPRTRPGAAPAPQPAAAPVDTTQRELQRIIALAGAIDAQSTYRITNDKDPTGEPGINYLVAKQITVN